MFCIHGTPDPLAIFGGFFNLGILLEGLQGLYRRYLGKYRVEGLGFGVPLLGVPVLGSFTDGGLGIKLGIRALNPKPRTDQNQGIFRSRASGPRRSKMDSFGYCPPRVTVYISGPMKGYI